MEANIVLNASLLDILFGKFDPEKDFLLVNHILLLAIPKQLFTLVSVKVVDIYLAASQLNKYPPLFTSTSVKNC